MKYTPDYQVQLKDKVIPLLFHTSMYRKYCEYKGIQLKDLFQRIQNTIPVEGEDHRGEMFTALDLADILLLAHQCYCRGNKIECTADEFEADDWIEQLGGFVGAMEENTKIFTLFVSRLARVTDEAVIVDDKKKMRKAG